MKNQSTNDFPEWVIWGVVLVWGANYVVGKWGMAGFDPLSFTVLRFVGASPLLLLLLYALERDIRVELKDCWSLALIGLVGVTIYQTLFMAAVKYATATNASLMLAVSPVFTALFAWMAGQERLGSKGQRGSALSLLGVVFVLLFGTNKLALGWDVLRGDLIALLASCIWGLYPVLAKRMLCKYSALKTITFSSLFGTIFLLVVGLKGVTALSWSSIPYSAWGSVLFSTLLVTVYGLVVWYYAISRIGVNRVMAYMYAVPAVAVIMAAIILREQIHILQIVGAGIIFWGIRLIRKDRISITEH
ncbi:DMT(drug/metabolite transporter) superfamily permease [Desulfosporosinus acidiphilus SJ4]|uniref:DMT(Drug/metabolite transporter) superfamily permease n=1 Tax=Desulfosporosinus acidiphilus (strain DSM 22704 / JCM 16185 / SJ4) TaxID=646529 RepID=I4D5D7_DESAJ|nr:DMT family transporter [Desulfosporosinus acidiphilus]AFM41011.1 DMT(drug/metabolite transporter) superfamily permease [Desulfosporosinus acidiphilus SJ4]